MSLLEQVECEVYMGRDPTVQSNDPTTLSNGVWFTEVWCLYLIECHDLRSSDFNFTAVPTEENLRDLLLGKVRREDRGSPPTVGIVRNHNPYIKTGEGWEVRIQLQDWGSGSLAQE